MRLRAKSKSASWIDCFSLNNDIVWNRVFLIIRYVQNTLKDIYIKCYNETYKRITYAHIDDIEEVQYRHTYLLYIHYNMLLIYGTFIS